MTQLYDFDTYNVNPYEVIIKSLLLPFQTTCSYFVHPEVKKLLSYIFRYSYMWFHLILGIHYEYSFRAFEHVPENFLYTHYLNGN